MTWFWLGVAFWAGGQVGFIIGATWAARRSRRRIKQDLWQQIHGVSGRDRRHA